MLLLSQLRPISLGSSTANVNEQKQEQLALWLSGTDLAQWLNQTYHFLVMSRRLSSIVLLLGQVRHVSLAAADTNSALDNCRSSQSDAAPQPAQAWQPRFQYSQCQEQQQKQHLLCCFGTSSGLLL